MHILITGGTGLIGRALCAHWLAQGHQIVVWSRTPARVRMLCGAAVVPIGHLDEYPDQPLDLVVNLAGAPIADRPWTARRKELLWESRVTLTEQLVRWCAERPKPPEFLLSGSAVGWYGDTGARILDEQVLTHGTDFASHLCAAWESAALKAQAVGTRVVLLRTGFVLAPKGGLLSRLLPPFRLGLGGRIGSGQQWMPWIHLADQIALMDFLVHQPSISGPYNVCAPEPVTNQAFTQALGQSVRRPTFCTMPGALLRMVLGEMALLLLGGQRALPTKALQAGFRFRFTALSQALNDIVH